MSSNETAREIKKNAGQDSTQRQKEKLEDALSAVDIGLERCPDIGSDKKHPEWTGHNDPSNWHRPTELEGNYGVKTGNGLLVIDIDDWEAAPDELTNLLERLNTLVIVTPHGGSHHYFRVEDDAQIKTSYGINGIDIQYEGVHVVGPGSVFDHTNCETGKEGCPGHGTDEYEYQDYTTIDTICGDDLQLLIDAIDEQGGDDTTTNDAVVTPMSEFEFDDNTPDRVRWLCTVFLPNEVGRAGEEALLDVLRGGSGSLDNLQGDRSAATVYALEKLYGAFLRRHNDEDKAAAAAVDVFRHFVANNQFTKRGNRRKCLDRNDDYVEKCMKYAISEFGWGEWNQWRRWDHDDDDIDHELQGQRGLSDVTKGIATVAVYLLSDNDADCDDLQRQFGVDFPADSDLASLKPDDRQYPTAKEVANLCSEVDDRSHRTYRDAVSDLVNDTDRIIRATDWASPNGERHVYIPNTDHHEVPVEADLIKINGETFDKFDSGSVNLGSVGVNPWTGDIMTAD